MFTFTFEKLIEETLIQHSSPGIFDLLVGIVVFQYFLIAFFLFSLRKEGRYKTSNSYLSVFFCLVAVNLVDAELMLHGAYSLAPGFALLEDCLVFTYGPIIYLYCINIVSPDRQSSLKHIFHFIPAMLVLGVVLIFFTASDKANQLAIIDAIRTQRLPVTSSLISFSLAFGHFFSYLILAGQIIKRYHRSLRDQYASLENRNVSWLTFTLKVLAATFIVSWLSTFLSILQQKSLAEVGLLFVVVILLYYINRFVLKALKDPQLFRAVEGVIAEEKNLRAALEPKEIEEIRSKLGNATIQLKLYRDADLSIDRLSGALNLPSRKVSQFLNEVFHQSFFDYINSLRIEEAKSILLNSPDPKLTVQEVMYQVGFNSKSSFNTLFKEKTGKTPSQFRKDGLSS